MGGDALTVPAKRLTNEEFEQVVREVLERVEKLCQRIQVYPPLPEKTSHGDVDFLVILRKEATEDSVVGLLECKEHVKDSHGKTLNCEYKGYQVDFKFVDTDVDFEMAIFYKSYSGVGSYLGYLTHSETVSLSEKGLYAIRYITPTIKHKYLVTNVPSEILHFYGVDPKRFNNGFERKEDLFRYLMGSRFFDFERFVKGEGKNLSKILSQMRQYCLNLPETDPLIKKKEIPVEDICLLMLEEFKKRESFESEIESIKQKMTRTRNVKDKFNGKHIMELFGTAQNKLNEQKKKFRDSFGSEKDYEDFILQNTLEQIAANFEKIVLKK